MLDSALLYAGSGLMTVRGVAHLLPTKGVVAFGSISPANKRVSTMDWVAKRLALCSIGLTALAGARTAILPMKLCPFVKTAGAAMRFAGSMV